MGYAVYYYMPCIAFVPYRVRGLPGLHFLGGGVEMMFPKKPYNQQRKARAAKRVRPKTCDPEKLLQRASEQLLELQGIEYIRIPDSVYQYMCGSKYIPIWIGKLAAYYFAGRPDLTLLLPNGRYHCIELKSEIGTLSAGQKRFRNSVGIDNFTVCRTIEEVQAVIDFIKK